MKSKKSGYVTIVVYDDKTSGFLKSLELHESYVVNSLGFDRNLILEGEDDMDLYGKIYDKHLVLEGFLDSLRSKFDQLKSFGDDVVRLAQYLKQIITEGTQVSAIKDRAIALTKKNAKSLARVGDGTEKYVMKLEDMTNYSAGNSGWVGLITSISTYLLSEAIGQNIDWFKDSTKASKFNELAEMIQDDVMNKGGTDTLVTWIRYIIIAFGKFINVISTLKRLLGSSLALASQKGVVVGEL